MDELFVKAFIYFATEISDVHVDHVRPAFIVEIPEIVFYHLAREHYSSVADHVFEQSEFFAGEVVVCALIKIFKIVPINNVKNKLTEAIGTLLESESDEVDS